MVSHKNLVNTVSKARNLLLKGGSSSLVIFIILLTVVSIFLENRKRKNENRENFILNCSDFNINSCFFRTPTLIEILLLIVSLVISILGFLALIIYIRMTRNKKYDLHDIGWGSEKSNDDWTKVIFLAIGAASLICFICFILYIFSPWIRNKISLSDDPQNEEDDV